MAIPFFESSAVEPTVEQNQNVDQVDGPVISHHSYQNLNTTHEAPLNAMPLPSPIEAEVEDEFELLDNEEAASSTSGSSASSSSPPPNTTTQNDELVWKTLAVAMCKVLKEHFIKQTAQQTDNTPITSAVVQITPNGHVNPIWK